MWSTETEGRVSELEDAVKELKSTVQHLKATTKTLEYRAKDAKNCARCNNLSFIGFPEEVELARTETFLEDS